MIRRAFSLIELLIVIALIAVLLAIIVPSLAAGKERSRNIICQSNLRQNALSALIFEQDNGHFPYGFISQRGFSSQPPGRYLGSGIRDKQGWWWLHHIAGGVSPRQNAVFYCPSQKQTDNLLCGHYGANAAIFKNGDSISNSDSDSEFHGTPPAAARIRHPARTLLLADAGYVLINRFVVLPSEQVHFDNPMRLGSFFLPGLETNAARRIDPDQQADAHNGRHLHRSVNTAFADGSVQSLRAAQLAATASEAGQAKSMFIWSP